MIKVFVDGQEGTTGLKIHERLAGRTDVEMLQIDPEKRKDPKARQDLLNAADVAFLCLPDVASKESAGLVTNPRTRVLDASTAHRTDPAWAYGFPELSASHRQAIQKSTRIAVPGCHASGFASLVYPLVKQGVIAPDYPVTCHSITGYSGGGKKLIAAYEEPSRNAGFKAPRAYALAMKHKHLPEMKLVSGLSLPPVFDPICGDFYQGMAVYVPLHTHLFKKQMAAKDLHELFTAHYANQRFVRVMPFDAESNLDAGFLDPTGCNGTNRLDILVYGHDTQVMLVARLDNLGKGASGAAVQCMNIATGADEASGLTA